MYIHVHILSCLALPNIFGFDSASRAASVAQSVEYQSRRQDVAGSNPGQGSSVKITGCYGCMSGLWLGGLLYVSFVSYF